MSSRHLKLAAAAAAWLATAAFAAAEPTTPAATRAQRTPVYRQLPTGDFWPADGDAIRAADAPAPPKDALAREEGGTGGVK